ncbi:hypothetical protein RchiOBHm_Chr5g0055351 [Rosa chinensis]|uniref:Uncharacterized protein n=1 Tax=Rosa chinensis TaxID=74649 RepID=A0A2P6QGC8_ROSCH|nr:hypothetical protein RchiOBHm_Chr5g0055351 [Rosa chinensis]
MVSHSCSHSLYSPFEVFVYVHAAGATVQVKAGTLTASAGRNFDSNKSHFIAGICWTRLLGVLPREHQG